MVVSPNLIREDDIAVSFQCSITAKRLWNAHQHYSHDMLLGRVRVAATKKLHSPTHIVLEWDDCVFDHVNKQRPSLVVQRLVPAHDTDLVLVVYQIKNVHGEENGKEARNPRQDSVAIITSIIIDSDEESIQGESVEIPCFTGRGVVGFSIVVVLLPEVYIQRNKSRTSHNAVEQCDPGCSVSQSKR